MNIVIPQDEKEGRTRKRDSLGSEQPRWKEEQPRWKEEQPLWKDEQPRWLDEQPRWLDAPDWTSTVGPTDGEGSHVVAADDDLDDFDEDDFDDEFDDDFEEELEDEYELSEFEDVTEDDLVEGEDPRGILATTVEWCDRQTSDLAPDQLARAEAPGKWSLVEILQHLADSELVWGWRLRMVLAQDRPQITGYDQDRWAERLHYRDADVTTALDEFAVLRNANLRLLGRATPADLARVGVHAERGEESVAHMMRLYAGHDILHLRQLERIRNAVAGR